MPETPTPTFPESPADLPPGSHLARQRDAAALLAHTLARLCA